MPKYTCTHCGAALTVINMSEDETLCQKCYNEILATIEPLEEDTSVRWLKDRELDEIAKSPCPQIHHSLPHLRRRRC